MRRIALATVLTLALPAGTAWAETRTYSATGAEQTFAVPAGVTSVEVTATGESGSGLGGGRGAVVSGAVSVTPGSTLFVEVGKRTFNGGGTSGGGGASDVRTVGGTTAASLNSRLLVAAGGGAGGRDGSGGDAEGPVPPGTCGGQPGQAGGAGGTGATSGTAGRGGNGANSQSGGGGGGWVGGGGGGAEVVFVIGPEDIYCGGGGGSNKVPAGATSALADRSTLASVRIDYTVPPAPAGGSVVTGGESGATTRDAVKPGLLGLSFSPSAFRAAKSGAAITAKVGTKVGYRLTEAAATTFTVRRAASGRKKGKRCVKPTRKNRKAKRCTRYVKVRGSFTHAGKAGANRFTFRGRIGGRKLRPGRYRLIGTAKDAAGNASKALSANFRIKK